MKRKWSLVLLFTMIVLVLCSCGSSGSTVKKQVMTLTFEIGDDFVVSSATPAPAEEQAYVYDDYKVYVSWIGKADSDQALEKAREDALGLGNETEGSVKEKSVTVAGLEGSQWTCRWDYDQDGVNDTKALVTAVETNIGVYVISMFGELEAMDKSADKVYSKIIKSVSLTDEEDPEVYAANVGQAYDFVFSLPEWETRLEQEGKYIAYYTMDMDWVVIKELRQLDDSEENMEAVIEDIYGTGDINAVKVLEEETFSCEGADGTAVVIKADLEFQNGNTETTTALFVKDNAGKLILAFINPYASFDYQKIIETIQWEPLDADDLWENKTEYAGDNSAVVALVNAAGPLVGESNYTIQLETEKEPYGLVINYDYAYDEKQMEREAILMLGLIENLDYVEIHHGSEIYQLTADQACSQLKYDVKRLGKSKPLMQRYLLESLF